MVTVSKKGYTTQEVASTAFVKCGLETRKVWQGGNSSPSAEGVEVFCQGVRLGYVNFFGGMVSGGTLYAHKLAKLPGYQQGNLRAFIGNMCQLDWDGDWCFIR